MLMVEDPGAVAVAGQIADLKGFSVLACGIGSLTQALGGDRAAGEAGTQKVLAESKRAEAPEHADRQPGGRAAAREGRLPRPARSGRGSRRDDQGRPPGCRPLEPFVLRYHRLARPRAIRRAPRRRPRQPGLAPPRRRAVAGATRRRRRQRHQHRRLAGADCPRQHHPRRPAAADRARDQAHRAVRPRRPSRRAGLRRERAVRRLHPGGAAERRARLGAHRRLGHLRRPQHLRLGRCLRLGAARAVGGQRAAARHQPAAATTTTSASASTPSTTAAAASCSTPTRWAASPITRSWTKARPTPTGTRCGTSAPAASTAAGRWRWPSRSSRIRYTSGTNMVWGFQMRRSIRRKNEWAYLTPRAAEPGRPDGAQPRVVVRHAGRPGPAAGVAQHGAQALRARPRRRPTTCACRR